MKRSLKIGIGFFTVWGVINFAFFSIIVVNYLKEDWEDWRTTPKVKLAAIPPASASQVSSSTVVQPVVEPVEITHLSSSDFERLTLSEKGEPFYYLHFKLQPVTYQGKSMKSLKFSPLRDKVGFLYESSNYGIAEDRALVALDIKTKRFIKVYQGTFRTGSWKWEDNHTIIVLQSCGTHCLLASRRDAGTGKELAFYNVYGLTDAVAGFPPSGLTSTDFEEGEPMLINERVSPNGLYRAVLYRYDNRSEIDEDFYEIHLVRLADDLTRLVYQGDFRTIDWIWLSDQKIKIDLSCGQQCQTSEIVDLY
ncbi:MAG: hypothetical protein HYV42_03250 [Candidatus Magasanikbacteria bacterium]|nr:hypothetical protein [Candidatus Magasanikbacteria bacterium]